jgi:CheY-like chemotaxis protein
VARILVIDDQPMIRDNCREALEDAGHTVTVAPDGREGVRIYLQEPVDLVVLDLYMPDRDGLERSRNCVPSPLASPSSP